MKRLNLDQIRKDQAKRLRAKGMSLGKVASMTGMTKNMVSCACRSITITEENKTLDDKMKCGEACMFCGDPITQPHGSGRRRRFCSTFCRREYWKIHRSELKQSSDAFHTMLCAYCGKTFEVYGRNNRKYCCHEHYLFHRNGAKVDNFEA